MTLLAGIVNFEPGESLSVDAEKVALDTAHYKTLQHRLLHSDEFLTLYVIERTDDDPEVPTWTNEVGSKYWLTGDVNYFSDSLSYAVGNDLECLVSQNIPGRWVAVEVNFDTSRLRLATDRLGIAWLYIAKIKNGYVFSSDYSAVAKNINGKLKVNKDAVLLELTLGYHPGNQTVFEEISIAPPGSIIEFGRSGLIETSKYPIRYSDRHANNSLSEKYKILDEIYDRIITEHVNKTKSHPILSISAGYDSRYALSFLKKHSIDPLLFTFGNPKSAEIEGARAVCKKFDLDTSVFPILESNWEQWRRCIQQLGNTGMTQWSGWGEDWLSFLHNSGSYSIIGYLGDSISGKHLGTEEPRHNDWLQYWIQWSTASDWAESKFFRTKMKNRLNECLQESFKTVIQNADYAFPHQQALQLDLYTRQRRWVATQPNLISRFLSPVLFFYDNELMEFWTSVPASDLFGQKLYLSYAHSRFPRLFPRHEKKNKSFATRATQKLSRLIHARLSGASFQPRPPVINHDLMIIPNKKHIIELTLSMSDFIEDIIDVESFCKAVDKYGNTRTISSDEILKMVNLLFILELAAENN